MKNMFFVVVFVLVGSMGCASIRGERRTSTSTVLYTGYATPSGVAKIIETNAKADQIEAIAEELRSATIQRNVLAREVVLLRAKVERDHNALELFLRDISEMRRPGVMTSDHIEVDIERVP